MLKSMQRKLITDMPWAGTFVLRRQFVVLSVLDSALGIFSDQDEVQAFRTELAKDKKLIFKPEKALLLFLCSYHSLDSYFIIELFRLF